MGKQKFIRKEISVPVMIQTWLRDSPEEPRLPDSRTKPRIRPSLPGSLPQAYSGNLSPSRSAL